MGFRNLFKYIVCTYTLGIRVPILKLYCRFTSIRGFEMTFVDFWLFGANILSESTQAMPTFLDQPGHNFQPLRIISILYATHILVPLFAVTEQ